MAKTVFGEAVRRYRESYGLSQAEVAAEMEGMGSQSWLSNRESGKAPLSARQFKAVLDAAERAQAKRGEGDRC